MSILYVMRHAQASFGNANYDSLSETGHKQARVLAEYLLHNAPIFDFIYAGTMVRHQETLEAYRTLCREQAIACPAVITNENLNEYDSKKIITTLIPALMKEDESWKTDLDNFFTSKKSFQKIFNEVMRRWIAGNPGAPDIESWENFYTRVNKTLDEIMAEHGRGKTIGIFTSGGTISTILKRALSLSDEKTLMITWQIVNASISQFKCTNDNLMLSTFNEHAYLLKHEGMVTYR